MTYTSSFSPVLGFHPESVEISNSEMQNFKDCRRKWYFINYLGLEKKDKPLSGPLVLGTLIHAALEKYYTTNDPNDLLDTYVREANKQSRVFEESFFAEDEKERKKFYGELDLGRIMLEGYLEWEEELSPDVSLKITSVEEKLVYNIKNFCDDRVSLIGKVDARARRVVDDSILVMDHKTVAAGNWGAYLTESGSSEQFLHYNLLEHFNRDNLEDKVDGGVYNLLKKVKRTATAKPPFYGRVDVRFYDDQLKNYYYRVLGVVQDMITARNRLDAGENHHNVAYPHITKECSWKCPMYQFCVTSPTIDETEPYGFYEEIIADNFRQVDPLQRYKEEAEIKEEITGLSLTTVEASGSVEDTAPLGN